jgi:hypothetical protein
VPVAGGEEDGVAFVEGLRERKGKKGRRGIGRE